MFELSKEQFDKQNEQFDKNLRNWLISDRRQFASQRIPRCSKKWLPSFHQNHLTREAYFSSTTSFEEQLDNMSFTTELATKRMQPNCKLKQTFSTRLKKSKLTISKNDYSLNENILQHIKSAFFLLSYTHWPIEMSASKTTDKLTHVSKFTKHLFLMIL